MSLRSPPLSFEWRGTWRSTYLNLPDSYTSHVSCANLFSDALYRPFQCAHTPLEPYTTNIPPQNAIPRLADLTPEEFAASWTDKPFVLTSPVKHWPIYRTWTTASLLKKYGRIAFRAEAVDWPLETYVSYMHHNTDESPLYLFDRSFAEKMSLTADQPPSAAEDNKPSAEDTPAAYWPPTCFGEDLFAVLGNDRPDSRWLIMGPARSGSTFHKDPNGTSAWNAVLTGRKYWLMFPSAPTLPPPPGVILSADASEITSPLSIAEYLLCFHEAARATPGCREGVCGPGEVLHVPSGWFHLVLNLEEGIAVTGNFVPQGRLADVLAFMRDCGDQVSGFREDVVDPYGLFVRRLGEVAPEVLGEGLKEVERRAKGRKGRWEELVKGDVDDGGEGGGFSFGFGDGEDSG